MNYGKVSLRYSFIFIFTFVLACTLTCSAKAQEFYPEDNGIFDYHKGPDYRQSESHPLRIVGYALHPVGWVLREAIFRPISWMASSTEESRSVLGYRDPRDFRKPSCFSSNDEITDCRKISPFNYKDSTRKAKLNSPEVNFPEVNFEFNKSSLNDLGRGRIHQIADLLKTNTGARIVLHGHTDIIGTDSYNEKLGSARAETVKTELSLLGISADRMTTVTYGRTKPELGGGTDSVGEPWARAVNRRVEVRID